MAMSKLTFFTLLAGGMTGLLFAPVSADAREQRVSNRYSEGTLSPLSGVYVGAYGGYGWNDADISAGPELDVNGWDTGFFVGYQVDTLLDRTLGLGVNGALEFHYGWSDADDETVTGGTTFTTEKEDEWGFSFRPGLSIVDDYVYGLNPYGIIGYKRAKFETSSGTTKTSEDFDGFSLGLGTEVMAFGDAGLRLDYTHTWYEDKGGIDPSGDDLRLGLAYHF